MSPAAYIYNQPLPTGSSYGGSYDTAHSNNGENYPRDQQQQEEVWIGQPVIVQGRRR